ncbi:hypothetical protein ARSEF4850_002388 [Beauveria asiatica]
MVTGWRWMTGWWGAALPLVTLLLARSFHRVISKIGRPRDENRSGRLDFISGKDDAKFEIIAVPGLGAHPYHTWEARKTKSPNAAECHTAQSSKAHLLKDLLAHKFPDARIWNFAHESNWLIDAPVKTTEEIGKCLLKEIRDKRPAPYLPIIFIGHSLGGIIIKQALCTSGSQDIIDDTAGIIFLGAPHQGSSVSIAGAVLAALTGFLGSDTTLLLSLKNHGAQLSNLADAFDSRIAPNGRRQRKVPITSFYETKKTYILGLSLGICGGPADALFAALTTAIQRLRTPSLLEQADTWIRDEHYTTDRLRIERLSGELLSMNQCYINLAIVENSGQEAYRSKKGATAPSQFSIFIRQKVETPDKNMQVELSDIFNQRKASDGQPMHPRRILIRGRAGVGKTSLCKKIIHEFTKGTWGKWNNLFDRVLWVPLRNLKLPERRKKAKYTFEHLLSHEFRLPTDGQNLAAALSRVLHIKSSKTLFLLDGLDEVTHDLTGDSGMSRFLDELLNQPNVVITSRPSAKAPPNLDLELETIGFGPDQVNEYIEKSFTSPETGETDQDKVDNVQSFLREHWLIQGLVRIPIQLDALCYTWDEFDPKAVPVTMTGMYNIIVQKLWKKDIVRLEKVKEGYAKVAHAAEVEGRATAEIALVECLAFIGLHNDVIDFALLHRAARYDIFWRFVAGLLDEDGLAPDFINTVEEKPLDLLGPTHQRLVMHCLSEVSTNLPTREAIVQQLAEWLLFECKFNESARLASEVEFPEVVLQTALLNESRDIQEKIISSLASRATISPSIAKAVAKRLNDDDESMRLAAIRALEKCGTLPNKMLRALAGRLNDWDWHVRCNAVEALGKREALPDKILKAVAATLDDEQAVVRSRVMETLGQRESLPENVWTVVAARLDNKNEDVRRDAVEFLVGRSALPDGVLTAVAARLDNENKNVRRAAVEVLVGCTALPDEALTAVAARLDDQDQDVRGAAVEALGCSSALSDEVLTAVAARLDDQDGDVRCTAIKGLVGRSALPDGVLMAVVARLDDQDGDVRCTATKGLVGRSALPDEVLTAVTARLDDKKSYVRCAAIQGLVGRSALPDEVLTAVTARLDDKKSYVRCAAIQGLVGRSALPDEVLTAVTARLDDQDWDVRKVAVEALGGRTALPVEVLTAVVARLNDREWYIREAAVKALGGRSALPGEVLTAVAARLGDENMDVRKTAIEVLGGRTALPEEILTAVAEQINHYNVDVRSAALGVLGRRDVLPNEVLMAVAAQLGDTNRNVRRAVVEVLGQYATLPDEVLAVVVAQLDKRNSDARRAAVETLGSYATPLNKVLTALTARLNDQDRDVRKVAVEALGWRSALPNEVLTALTARLDDQDRDVRKVAIEALGCRSALPDEVLVAVMARLDDQDRNVREAAVEALGWRSALPDEVLVAVMARLDDQDRNVRSVTVDLFMHEPEKFSRTFLKGSLIASLYEALLERSFREQLSWIIAVPGLGAHPYHTWEARKPQGPSAADYQAAQPARVHLLKDLLARDFPEARVWNFAHDSNWLIDAPVKTTAEIGKCLLAEIRAKRSALCSSGSQDIVDATSGILFLGTPHQGSSVSIAGAVLAWMTGLLGSNTTLLLSLKSNDQQLSTLAANFKQCIASSNKRRQENIRISSFYETKKTYLLGLSLGVIVSQNSAVVHDDADGSHNIDTDHSGPNKCGGPADTLYLKLTDTIRHLKAPSLLEQADTWIHDKHYTADRLKIERLSGEPLAMDQCYINLAIVEQRGQDADRYKNRGDAIPSPFSILARQKIEAIDKTMQVELAAIFNERLGSDGRPLHPRRILIRGRAGVGKTSLCKKIVYEFTNGTWNKWNELFDRVLWIPLRNLKLPERRKKAKYTFEHLLSHEFLLPTHGRSLAGTLSRTLDTKNSKTLFLLDGLDEVSQDLTGNNSMARFLAELLQQPNVIITSRPSARPPLNLHLELETVGFGTDQMNEYIERSFSDPKTGKTDHNKVSKVNSFLEEHWLIQGLVRIPIQLDAFCYTWDDLKPDTILNTMTGIYKEIDLKLWKKDILRLEKKHEDKYLTEVHLERAGRRKIERFVKNEMAFVESLAFTGLHCDIIDFTSEQLESISDHFTPSVLPDKTLPLLSFLRTSNRSSEYRYQNYHFMHLTFQEYFAARYFTRQWTDSQAQLQLLAFTSTARYDIFWRFVAGLLDDDGLAPDFINTIEEEPLDLLGPTHQRLVMHCLSEISTDLPMREALEQRLARWLLFECTIKRSASLASEVEFPEAALRTALLNEPGNVRKQILSSLASRATIPPSIVEAVAAQLKDEDSDVRSAAVNALSERSALPDEVLMAVAARLDDEDPTVRGVTVQILSERSTLPDAVLMAVAARLDDEDSGVRSAAVKALGKRLTLPDEVLMAVAARLDDDDWDVQRAAVKLLGERSTLPDEVLRAVAARLDAEDSDVRSAAVNALGERLTLPDQVLMAVAARLDDDDWGVRLSAVAVPSRRSALPDEVLMAVAARLGDEDSAVGRAALDVFMRNDENCSRSLLKGSWRISTFKGADYDHGSTDDEDDSSQSLDDLEAVVAPARRSIALVDERHAKDSRHEADQNLGGDAAAVDTHLTADRANLQSSTYAKGKVFATRGVHQQTDSIA